MLTVSLAERSYPIEIAESNLDRIGAFLAEIERRFDAEPVTHAVVLTDENVSKHGYAHTVADSLNGADVDVSLFVVAAGEGSKSLETAATLWETLVEDGADRKTLFVAVGGGVIGDLGGFVAATYARGIRFFQVPTTLLAQVDSSVGGKVGINLPAAKNMVGAFHQPLGVIIDVAALRTLDEVQYACGLGEVAKYALSLDAELLERIETGAERLLRRDGAFLREVITRCCEIKADIVARDERETADSRVLLNYGHTFAHALETLSGYKIPHGQAVAVGCVAAARLAKSLDRIDAAVLDRHVAFLQTLHLPTCPADLVRIPGCENLEPFDPERVVAVMARDKKVEHGRLRFVLPTALGRCEAVADVDTLRVLRILEK